jgi:hypothetical protein
MNAMRRASILIVAVGYGLSFVAVCLAACLMGPMVADHACCAGEDGIRTSDQDCCAVTPGVAHAGASVAPVLPPALMAPAPALTPIPAPDAAALRIDFASSPPLVLRV